MRTELWVAALILAGATSLALKASAQIKSIEDNSTFLSKSPGWYVVDVNSQPVTVAVGSVEWNKLFYRLAELERKTSGISARLWGLEHPREAIQYMNGGKLMPDCEVNPDIP